MKTSSILTFIIVLQFILDPQVACTQTLGQDNAITIAKEWMKGLRKNSTKESPVTKDVKTKKINDQTSFYAINFEGGGYVLIAGEEGIHPIIGYSNSEYFDENHLCESEKKWIECVSYNIENIRKTKKESQLKSAKIQTNIENELISIQSLFLTTTVSVPSLFETYSTSRWAYWYPYSIQLPNQDGANICVPLAMAQIIKYYHFPAQGVSSHSGTDFSKEWFNYSQMPFRLTYCGNGTTNCNEGSFDILPEITEVNSMEISHLIYMCGISVDMEWGGNGTYGNPGNWVSKMSQYFNYSPNWTYLNETYISSNKENFKDNLRHELLNKRPILFAYYGPGWSHGHAVVIDGFENNDYFHFAAGNGGYLDAYYYLFDYDNDSTHTQSPYYTYYRAAIGIEPNCSSTSIMNLNSMTISSGMNTIYQANDLINLNNVIVDGNGTVGGRLTLQAQNEVNLNSGFEVKTGGEAFITMQKCGQP